MSNRPSTVHQQNTEDVSAPEDAPGSPALDADTLRVCAVALRMARDTASRELEAAFALSGNDLTNRVCAELLSQKEVFSDAHYRVMRALELATRSDPVCSPEY
jgi:hypothetical protein